MRQTRTPFAVIEPDPATAAATAARRPEPIAVTVAGETRIFPQYRALRDAVLAEEQPLLDGWIAAAEARGEARGRRHTAVAAAIALMLPPLAVLLLGAIGGAS